MRKRKGFDLDRHRRQTQSRLVVVGFLILGVVGGGLVWRLYGGAAAITAVACMLGFAVVAGGLWLVLTLLERWVKSDDA